MRCLVLLALIAAVLGAGCSRSQPAPVAPQPMATAQPVAVEPPEPERPRTLADSSRGFDRSRREPVVKLGDPLGADPKALRTGVDSGTGLVLEPSGRTGSGALASFGKGCSRWLYFWVGAQPELGKTPMWTSMDTVRARLGRKDLALTPSHRAVLKASTGTTHAAFGDLRGSGGNCTLTYRLIDLETGAAVGAPVVARGAEAAVAAELPAIARELCRRLGVDDPTLPEEIVESAEELRSLGQLPWIPDDGITSEELDLIDTLSRRCLPAALLMVINRGHVRESFSMMDAAGSLMDRVGEHPLAAAETGRQFFIARAGRPTLRINRLLERHPNNYLLATAAVWQHLAYKDIIAARKAAEYAVRCAPHNPSSWLTLGNVYNEHSDIIREGRFVDDLSIEELNYLQRIYDIRLSTALEAIRLDEERIGGWYTVSVAAAFAGQAERAERALLKMLALQRKDPLPHAPTHYEWGLRLFGPNWYENPQRAREVARQAVAAAEAAGDRWTTAPRVDVATEMILAGVPEYAPKLIRSRTERRLLQEVLAANDVDLHSHPGFPEERDF
jgi:tetratricopeptide (TPR) repeat protein